jgi:hypothetical protein
MGIELFVINNSYDKEKELKELNRQSGPGNAVCHMLTLSKQELL